MLQKKQINEVIRLSLQDVQVELTEEFDRKFERKAFFTQAWARRKGEYRSEKPLLLDTGKLRRSVSSHIDGNRIVFTSSEPYAGIHNEGGVITVSAKMRSYFWRKYHQSTGGFERKQELSAEAEFYRAMALKPVGNKINIPRRRFIGYAPEVERIVRSIIEENLTRFFEHAESFKITTQ